MIKFIIILLGLVTVSFCVESPTIGRECILNKCGGFDLRCENLEPFSCPATYMPGDICRRFITCEQQGSVCNTIKSDNYDKCVNCFLSCDNIQTWDSCTLSCDEGFRELIS